MIVVLLSLLISASAVSIWPYPTSLDIGTTTLSIYPNSFQIVPDPTSVSPLLTSAIQRYYPLIFPFNVSSGAGQLTVLNVTVLQVSQNPSLQLGVDESYSLTIGSNGASHLIATTVWGALRGLETFSQCVDFDVSSRKYTVMGAPVTIQDSPRYPWRGLMIDTSRHFLQPSTIYRTIDALAYNKFNTLHWHTVDAESFPVVINSYPNLSQAGAYDPTLAVYSQAVIQDIVNYAYERGIRVVPEFDLPGHAYSWGFGYPQIRCQCPSNLASNINNYPLDPSNSLTLQVVDAVIGEMAKLFFDQTFHLGGDEVVESCWTGNANVSAWMKQQGYTTGLQVFEYFEDNFRTFMQKYNRTQVAWQDVYDDGVRPPTSVIFEVWEAGTTLQTLLSAGYQSLLAAPWYLDKQLPNPDTTHYEWIDTWQDFYNADPTNGITKNANLIIGGEAAMWAEQVDDTCFDERVWPRASAVGERLWSAQTVNNIADAKSRLTFFRCRVARRGIKGGPVQPDYCPLNLNPPA